jgi:phenylacetate-coenzyme A ligase PaaK-like adenylate-forming protein
MSTYEQTRQRHFAHLMGRLPQHLARLAWSADQLRTERTARLRQLLAVARAKSPWHRARLSEVDVDAIDEAGLRSLPVMTKTDLMSHFDEIVTDPRITLEQVDAHLAGLTTDAYLLDEFHAVTSGGSSGIRGAFVWGWDAWADLYLSGMRRGVSDRQRDPSLPPGPPRLMFVAARDASHSTAAASKTFSLPDADGQHSFPVTLPLEEIVEGLNRANGDTLITYASMLGTLVAEARAGRLKVSLRRIIATSEPLLPEIREGAREVWGAPVANQWGTSEGGILALGCYQSEGMHLADDLVIIELVDERGDPVPPGTESAKVLLTNLFNPIQPLIRYEITDRVTLLDEPCACGSAHRRIADIAGRLEDCFRYPGGVRVHPLAFAGVLRHDPRVIEYQVRQTARGAEILVRTDGPADLEKLERSLESELARVGCRDPWITAKAVDAIPRAGIGKLKRFVPLS